MTRNLSMNLWSSSALVLLIALTGCPQTGMVSGGDFCKTYEALVTGKLKLTRSEAEALRRVNRSDIVALKRHYRAHCVKEIVR